MSGLFSTLIEEFFLVHSDLTLESAANSWRFVALYICTTSTTIIRPGRVFKPVPLSHNRTNPADTIRRIKEYIFLGRINLGLTLVHRLRRWTNVKPTLIQRNVSAGKWGLFQINFNKKNINIFMGECLVFADNKSLFSDDLVAKIGMAMRPLPDNSSDEDED